MTDDVWVTTEIPLDNETRTALLLFNERLDARALAQRGKKRVAKAEPAKEAAATNVRKVNDNPDATAEQKAEAEAAYKAASGHFQVVQANPLAGEQRPKPKAEEPPAADTADDSGTADGSEASADAPAQGDELAEASADEEAPSSEEASPEGE